MAWPVQKAFLVVYVGSTYVRDPHVRAKEIPHYFRNKNKMSCSFVNSAAIKYIEGMSKRIWIL